MRTTIEKNYEAPSVEIFEIEVERAFADSLIPGGSDINDYGQGEDYNFDLG